MNNTIENNMPNIIMNSNKNQNILNRNDLLIISIFFLFDIKHTNNM